MCFTSVLFVPMFAAQQPQQHLHHSGPPFGGPCPPHLQGPGEVINCSTSSRSVAVSFVARCQHLIFEMPLRGFNTIDSCTLRFLFFFFAPVSEPWIACSQPLLPLMCLLALDSFAICGLSTQTNFTSNAQGQLYQEARVP